MLTRQELLQKIKDGIFMEEQAAPIYYEHISRSLPRYGFDPPVQKMVAEVMNDVAGDCDQHRRILEEIRDRVLAEAKDVY